jgi:large subunit ribosomal protein L13
MMERVIDAADCIVGRVASYAAKRSLLGDSVAVINCDKAVISGKRVSILEHAGTRFHRVGRPTKGPFMQHNSDRFFRRVITRMLPREKTRGREAVKRVMCYVGVPKQFEGKGEQVPGSHKDKLPSYDYLTVAQICAFFGGKR